MDKKKIDYDSLRECEFRIEDEETFFKGDLRLISIVMEPAMELDFNFFSEKGEKGNKYSLANVNNDRNLIIGVAMRPNKMILRKHPKTGEIFKGWFSKETVRRCSEIMMQRANHKGSNLEHSEILTKEEVGDKLYVAMQWIVEDPEMDTARAFGITDLMKDDWVVGFKCESPALLHFIKDYGFKGFSIEGYFAEYFAEKLSRAPINEIELKIEEEIKAIAFNNKLSDYEKEKQLFNLIFNK